MKEIQQGDAMMEVKIQRDADGKLKIDSWIKDVSPAGIILGNKRPAAPVEIAHVCATVTMNILALALPAVAMMAKAKVELEGGGDDQSTPKAN